MFSRHRESDCTSRILPNETAEQVAEPADRRDDESNEESNDENNDKVDEENDKEIDEDSDKENDKEIDDESDKDIEEKNVEQDGDNTNKRKNEQDDDENSLEFRIRPRDYPSPPPLDEKEEQLADAVVEHERLLALADWSANTYDHYHEELHTSQSQISDLRSPRNPTGLTIAARADAERAAVDMKSYWSICMEGERQRWINTRKEIKAIRVKLDRLKREVAAEAVEFENDIREKIESDEYLIMKGGKFVWL